MLQTFGLCDYLLRGSRDLGRAPVRFEHQTLRLTEKSAGPFTPFHPRRCQQLLQDVRRTQLAQ